MKILTAGVIALLLTVAPALRAQPSAGHWVGTWSTALVGRPQSPPPPGPPAPPPFMPSACPAVTPPAEPRLAPQPFAHLTNQTLRQIVHATVGGNRVRVVLSNAFGSAPVTIGAAHIALRAKDDAIQAGGGALTFSGRASITIPANAVAYSDPVALAVPRFADLAIDVYLPGTTNITAPVTVHSSSHQTSYISDTGNHAGAARPPMVATVQNWFFLSRVEVDAPDAPGVVVAFGDSITDGTASTLDANSRWPDLLARRLLVSGAPAPGVVNAGIGGNRLISEGAYTAGINALARFDADVLGQTGVTHVIVLEGINDIGNARRNPTPSAADLIAAHAQLIARAHAKGVTMIGATLTPFWGASYYTDDGEAKRQALNNWIRTGGGYDGVVDFDKATRDSNDPRRLLAAYDSCDHLHPSDAGYKAMADAIDLGLLKSSGRRER
jgi:lysophospholipase L1-like esterase